MPDVINLRQRLRTPYVWNGFSVRLQEIIKEARETGAILDVSTCRFGSDSAYLIDEANGNGNVVIVNKEELILDELLAHNRRVESIRNGEIENLANKELIWLDFEEEGDKSVKSLLQKIKSSPMETVWYASQNQKLFQENYVTVMAVLNMQFPKRVFDVSNCKRLIQIFGAYRSILSVDDLVESKEFWYIISNDYAIKCSVDNKSEVTIPAIGTFAVEEFITKNRVIPYWIGTESIAGNQHRIDLRNKLIKNIKTVDMVGRTAKSKSIMGLIKQYGDND